MPKISSTFAIVIILVVAIFCGGIIWFAGHRKEGDAEKQPIVSTQQNEAPQDEQNQNVDVQKTVEEKKTATELVYRDEKLGIEVRYENSADSMQKNDAPDNGDGNGIIVNGVVINRYENLGLIPSGFGGKRESIYDLMKDPNFTAQKKIDFQGNSAFSAIFSNPIVNVKEKEFFVEHNGKVFEISYSLMSDLGAEYYEKIVNNIRFID